MRFASPALVAALVCLSGCSLERLSGTVPRTASAAAAALADADSLHVEAAAPGVTWVRAWIDDGPWAIHVLEVDPARCRAQWEARKPAGTLDRRELTSRLGHADLAAMNADFFQLPGGTPVGAHVSGGVPFIGPADRAAWLLDRNGGMYAGGAELLGRISAGSDSVPLVQVNRAATVTSAYRPPHQGATLFTARAGRMPPADSGADVVWLADVTGDEREGRGRVLRVEPRQADTATVLSGTAALQLHGGDRAWAARRSAGEPVAWTASVSPRDLDGLPAVEAVGGFPLLLREGRDVLAETETRPSFGVQRHPRSAIGWSRRSGRIFLVLVDGRQAPYSDGMSLSELTALFVRLGATDALNLDGGGSSALVLRGRVVNRPSDREGERAVGNALALRGCR
jgi:hypothetical protein